MAPLQPASPSASSPPEVVRVRLVFLGAAGVGKTALIRRFLHDAFEARHRRTVEELHVLDLEPEPEPEPPATASPAERGLRLRLEVLDTSGSYCFPAMRRLGIRHGHAFALVYSPRDAPDSFEELERLRAEILEAKGGADGPAAAAPPPLLVVANKSDLPAPGAGSSEARLAERVRREWGARYLEASAKQGRHVGRLFQELLTLSRVEALGGRRRLSPALRRRRRSNPEAAGKEPPPPPPPPLLPRRRLPSKGGPGCAVC